MFSVLSLSLTYVGNTDKILHVREEPPGLLSPLRVVDERGTVGHRTGPGHRHRLPPVVGQLQDGVEVEAELGEGEEDHHQGGRPAGELLHVGEHPGHGLQGRLLLRAQAVVLYDLCNKQSQLGVREEISRFSSATDSVTLHSDQFCARLSSEKVWTLVFSDTLRFLDSENGISKFIVLGMSGMSYCHMSCWKVDRVNS